MNIKVNGYSFVCNPIELGETNLYSASHSSGVGLYYMAERNGMFAYSQTRYKALKNLEYLEKIKEIESKPLDVNMEMDLDCFVFWYKYATGACSDFNNNLIRDMAERRIKRQKNYTIQQLICFSFNRFNHDVFTSYIQYLDPLKRPVIYRPDCEYCKKNLFIPFKCRTELLDRSK